MSIIGFGRWNFYYYYILISTITKFIKEDILGLGSDSRIFFRLHIVHHPIMVLFIGFFSDFLIGIIYILYKYFKENKNNDIDMMQDDISPILPKTTTNKEIIQLDKVEKNNFILINDAKEEKEQNERIMTVASRYSLIHNDLAEIKIDILKQNTMKFILLCSFLIVVKEFFTSVAYNSNDIFDYYFLNLIIISIILIVLFNQKLYNHQILSIIFVSIISGSCLISCLVYLIENPNIRIDNDSFSINFKDKYYLIIILIIVYIIISILFCMGIIIQKNLMEIKFIAPQKLLFWKGFFGVISCIIGLIITSTVPCNIDLPPPPNLGQGPPRQRPGGPGPDPGQRHRQSNNTLELFQIFVCTERYGNKFYFDNVISYFERLTNEFERPFNITNVTRIHEEDKYDLNTKIVIEVFMILGYFIFHYISELYLIIVNNNLGPIYYLITESLFNLIHIPFQMIARKVKEDAMKKRYTNEEDYYETEYNSFFKSNPTRILKLIAVFIELLGYLIYMEIIHLNFCGLNRNIAKNIDIRAKIETLANDDLSLSNNSDDEDYNINNII